MHAWRSSRRTALDVSWPMSPRSMGTAARFPRGDGGREEEGPLLRHPRRRAPLGVRARTATTTRSLRKPRRKLRQRPKPSPRRSPQLRPPRRARARAKAKARAKESASAGTSTTRPQAARRAPSAPSCTSPRRWLRRWRPRALLLSRVLRARSASRLAALALSDKPGRRRRQLSRRPPRASQCGFWIPAPATTW